MNDKQIQEAFIQFLALKSGAKTQQELEKYVQSLGEDGLKQAYQEFIQTMQKQAQKAAHGVKLQYLKSLKHQCAEDEELYYYKKGGSLECGCKKKEDGGEVTKAEEGWKSKFKNRQQLKKEKEVEQTYDEKTGKMRPATPAEIEQRKKNRKDASQGKEEGTPPNINKGIGRNKKGGNIEKDCGGSAVIAKFKAKCGTKMKKHKLGGNLNGIPFYQDGGKNKKSINDYYLTDYSEPNILQKAKLNGRELTIKVNKGQQKGEDPITIQGNNYYLKGDSTLVKDNSIPYSFLQLRNAGINKKYNGGSLNQIPFYLAGTLKGGLPTAPKAEDRYRGGLRVSVETKGGRYGGNDRMEIKEVLGKKPGMFGSVPFIRLTVLHSSVSPDYNDTTYIEVPERKNFLVERKLRGVEKHPSVFKTYYSNVYPFFGSILPDLGSGTKEEYETLKRRFNTAWNLAK